MTDRIWKRNTRASKETWEYGEYIQHPVLRQTMPHWVTAGYIRKKKNKPRCRDWLVYSSFNGWGPSYLGCLTDMKRADAQAAAQLLIGAQHET